MSLRRCLTNCSLLNTLGVRQFSSTFLGIRTRASCYYLSHRYSTDKGSSATDQHKLFMEQLEELDQERQSIFGPGSLHGSIPGDHRDESISVPLEPAQDSLLDVATTSLAQVDDWRQEREALYGFTVSERDAWSASSSQKHSADYLRQIELAREQHYASLQSMEAPDEESTTGTNAAGYSGFTHLAMDGTTINMVDVGPKMATHRTATAQSVVTFPEAVLEAFGRSGHGTTNQPTNELVGPKGPIFATSITAGIMAAKQTSNLIPLCHPLPLEKVHVEISWTSRNSITIECTCSVTHKTGVEMEALMGASVAALTVYDMCKAVSHDLTIDGTRLIQKFGGKRDVDKRS